MVESAARSMRAVVRRRRVRAAGWARGAALFALVLFVVAGGGHRMGLVDTPSLVTLLAIVAALALAALLLAAFALVRVWRRGDKGGTSAVVAMLTALIVLVPFSVTLARALVYPQLSDISTDLDNPPAFSLAFKERVAGMNVLQPPSGEARERQAQAYPAISGRRYEYPRERVLQAVNALIADRGWRVLGKVESADAGHAVTIEAVARSFLLGFKSDVAIRVFDDSSATFVDMRSASRYGRGDLGDNAARIERFMDDLDDRMVALAGA